MTLYVGTRNWDYKCAIQSKATIFDVDKYCEDIWATGVTYFGTPECARLTSFAQHQFLDIYF